MPESDSAEIRRRRNELSCPETIDEISHVPEGDRDTTTTFSGVLDPLRRTRENGRNSVRRARHAALSDRNCEGFCDPVLLSFAQFEREVSGQRIRDKIAASKKKGSHRFLNFASRFSTKARMPSFWSSVANSEWKMRRSKRTPSASVVS